MQLYRKGTQILQEGDSEAGTDAFLLLEHVFSLRRADLYADPDRPADPKGEERYLSLIRQRLAHVPVQYLTGEASFFGYSFQVSPAVLIPRQDTEVLVERALELFKGRKGASVLDLCTGSGCILLSLLLSLEGATGVGTDLSREALEVARANREAMGVEAELYEGDLFDIPALEKRRFSLITANPPYIESEEIGELMSEVRDHEPRLALDGGADGLTLYRRICREASGHLLREGVLLMEIGYRQGEAVSRLCRENGFEEVRVIRDLSGLDRVVEAHARGGG